MDCESKKLLLVDDEPVSSMALSKLLLNKGYSVLTSSNGETALQIIHEKKDEIKLILMDIDLGDGIDGTLTAREILKDYDIPIIFLSSHTEKEIVEKTENITSYGYIVKNSGITVIDASIKTAFKLFNAHKLIQQENDEIKASFEELKTANNELILSQNETIIYADSLKKSEKTNRTIVNAIPDMLFNLSRDGTFLHYKSPYASNLYRDPEEFIGKKISDVMPEYISNLTMTAIENAILTRSTVTFEYDLIINDELKYFEDRIVMISDNEVLSLIRDITDRKKAELEILINNKRLNKALEIGTMGCWEYDMKTGTVWSSDELFKICNINKISNIIPLGYLSKFIPELNSVKQALIDLSIRGGEFKHEYVINPYGLTNQKIISLKGELIKDGKGNPVKISGVLHDITGHKQKEKILSESEERFRKLAEAAPIAIMIYQEDNFVFSNPAGESISGYNSAELRKIKFWDVVHPDYRELVRTNGYNRQAGNKEIERYEFKIIHKSGVEKWIDLTSSQIEFNGKPAGITAIVDITDRKNNEASLRKSEKMFRLIVEKSPIIMMVSTGAVQRFEYLNPEFINIFGYTLEDIPDASYWWPLAYPDKNYRNQVKEEWDRRVEKAIKNRSGIEPMEAIVTCRDGSKKHIEWGLIITEERSLVFGLDFTEHIKINTELEITRNYLKTVFNSLNSILISVDEIGSVTQWNSAAELYFNISAYDIKSRSLWNSVPYLKEYKINVDMVIKTQKPIELYKHQIKNKDGLYFNISIYPLRNEKSNGVVIRMDDITELHIKEQQLIQAQKMEMIGNLAGGLAHDFNNVLCGIVGTASLISHNLADTKEFEINKFKNNIELIEKSAQRAADMVKQLLTISKKHDIKMSTIDLNDAVKDVIELCKNTLDKSVMLNVKFHEGYAPAFADQFQIEQVLLNLCVNASHAMTIMRNDNHRHGGTLSISIYDIDTDISFEVRHSEFITKKYWIIQVTDTGIGMDNETKSRIFEPFFTTKGDDGGTGLGLSMVFDIVRQHKGFIDIYSQPGIGSTFKVYIPKINAKKNDRAEEQQNILRKGTGLILVVDDEEITSITARKILEKCGYNVISASDGKTAISILSDKKTEISLVILDLSMPGFSGKSTYIKMKEIVPGVKVLLSSGFKQDHRVNELFDLGINGFIQKPYTILDISQKISEILN